MSVEFPSPCHIRWSVAVILITIFVGCDDPHRASQSATATEKFKVVATVYPLGEIAREIGGQHVEVEWLRESGQPVELTPPDPDVQGRIHVADLVVSSGESFATDGFDDPFRRQQIVRLDSFLSAGEEGAPSGRIWLDPVAARELADELYKRLSGRRGTREPYFLSRRDAFIRDVNGVVDEYKWKIESAPQRRVIVLSDDFNRLLWRFKVTPVKPVDVEPTRISSRQIYEIRDAARKENITSMIVRADTPGAVMRDLEQKTGLRVIALDPLGSSAAGGRGTYVELLRYNLAQLWRAVTGQ